MTDFESQKEKRRELQIPLQGLGDDSTAGISTEEDKQLPYPALAPVVCFRLNQTTRPRNWCLKIACCPWLDMVSILIVLLNCVKQALYDPCKGESPNQVILDHLVFVYFLVEMLVKMVALGVYGHSGSYLSNNWHKFDVFVMFAEINPTNMCLPLEEEQLRVTRQASAFAEESARSRSCSSPD